MRFQLLGGITSQGPTPFIILKGKLDSNDFWVIFNGQIYAQKAGINWLTPPQSPKYIRSDNVFLNYILYLIIYIMIKLQRIRLSKHSENKPQTQDLFIKQINFYWIKILTEKRQEYIYHLAKVFPHIILNNCGAF